VNAGITRQVPWTIRSCGSHQTIARTIAAAGSWRRDAAAHDCCGRRAHTGDMGRMIGAILGAVLAAWVAFLAIGGMVAMVKAFAVIGLIAVVVAIVVWLLARRPRRG
jgi:predicted lipid-binding transport protein (Tim44 family)